MMMTPKYNAQNSFNHSKQSQSGLDPKDPAQSALSKADAQSRCLSWQKVTSSCPSKKEQFEIYKRFRERGLKSLKARVALVYYHTNHGRSVFNVNTHPPPFTEEVLERSGSGGGSVYYPWSR